MATDRKRILVTGATGFLGGRILQALSGREDIEAIAACRDTRRLPAGFHGEIRSGDLRDPGYRRATVRGVDVICHTGTWAAMWGHARQETENFHQPTLDLIEQAIDAGVERFLMTSTVAIAAPQQAGTAIDDFAAPAYTGFWPHLDRLIDVDRYMKDNADRGMQMITLRLGHFVGAGNTLGLVPALVPRLKTCLVPWIQGGKSRMPLIADSDLAGSFLLAARAEGLNNYESFNICGADFPTAREVIQYIADRTGAPKPLYSVPYPVAYLFGWMMEKLFPVLPGKAPFLTRSIVHLSEDWYCATDYASTKLGFRPKKPWKTALDEALTDLETRNYPWPLLAQKP